jgi:hypothetical protein
MATHTPLENDDTAASHVLTSLLETSARVFVGARDAVVTRLREAGDQSRTLLIVGVSAACVLIIAIMLWGFKRCLHRAHKFKEPIFEEVHEEVRRRSSIRRASMGAPVPPSQGSVPASAPMLPEFEATALSPESTSTFDSDGLVDGSRIHGKSPCVLLASLFFCMQPFADQLESHKSTTEWSSCRYGKPPVKVPAHKDSKFSAL